MAAGRGWALRAPLLALLLGLPGLARAGDRLVMGISPSLTATLNVIAQQQGFFAQQGLEVELRVIESGSKAVGLMLREELDVSESSIFSLVHAGFERRDFGIYAQVSISGNDNMIVARRDRGITTVGDLKGKRVGVLQGAFPHYVLDLMLLGAGLDVSQVRLVPEENGRLKELLAAGELDAACLYGGWADRAAQALGADAVVFHDDKLVRVTVVHAAKLKTLERRREEFQRLLRAHLQAEAYVKRHPDEAMRAVVEYLKLDLATAQRLWRPAMVHVALEQALVKDLENLASWQVDVGLRPAAGRPDPLDLIRFGPLLAVDPSRVTIAH